MHTAPARLDPGLEAGASDAETAKDAELERLVEVLEDSALAGLLEGGGNPASLLAGLEARLARAVRENDS